MNLTIDANILLDELTREGGITRSILKHAALGTIYIAAYTWNEAMYVLDNRLRSWVRSGRLTADIPPHFETNVKLYARFRCTVIAEDYYRGYEAEVRRRVPDDPDDWHTVALALATDTDIWTLGRKHFFGCGIAIWRTSRLRASLAAAT